MLVRCRDIRQEPGRTGQFARHRFMLACLLPCTPSLRVVPMTGSLLCTLFAAVLPGFLCLYVSCRVSAPCFKRHARHMLLLLQVKIRQATGIYATGYCFLPNWSGGFPAGSSQSTTQTSALCRTLLDLGKSRVGRWTSSTPTTSATGDLRRFKQGAERRTEAHNNGMAAHV